MKVLDEIDEIQIWGMGGGSLDEEASTLIQSYAFLGIESTLTQSEISTGLDDCHEIAQFLNDPNIEYELSTNIEQSLKIAVSNIQMDLSNAQ